MTSSLDEHVALVTGAGRGVGRAIAVQLARAGCRTAILARNEEDLAATVAEAELPSGSTVLLPVKADPTHDAALEKAVRIIMERLGNITLLVNAAGFAPPRETVMKTALADWDRILATCLRAPMVLARLVLPDMLAHGHGTIVNIAPSTGAQGRAGESAYAAAKFGLLGFTQSLAAEVREHGVTVTAIVPASVQQAASAAYESDGVSGLEPGHIAAAVLDILRNPARPHPTEIPLPSPA